MFAILELLQKLLFSAGWLAGVSLPAALSREEEARLIAAGDTEALIEGNLRLVAHIAKKYKGSGVEADDLISIGTVGLIKAVNTYEPGRGRLAGYAARCIENEILMQLRRVRRQSAEVSLDEPVGSDSEGNHLTLRDILPADGADVSELVARSADSEAVRTLLPTVLSPRERLVIELRYGTEALPQRVVAQRLGISRSYVSRIEKAALRRLHKALSE